MDGVSPQHIEIDTLQESGENIKFKKSDVVVINLSGRGDKDLDTYMKFL